MDCSGETWTEDFDIAGAKTMAEAQRGVEDSVFTFNYTLRPGALPRILDVIEVGGDGKLAHDWEKTSLVTEFGKFGGAAFDRYRCRRCGITGKRYGLSETISRDRKYSASKWSACKATE